MSDDPVGVAAIACVTVCLELFAGFCLDFASTSKSLWVSVAHAFNPPLQLTRAPVVSARGNSILARKIESKTKRYILENGIISYPSLKRRGE